MLATLGCFGLFAAVAFAANLASPQKLVSTYRNGGQRSDRTAYWRQVKGALGNNRKVPQVTENTLRVATYNIHFYQDIKEERDNLGRMLEDIEAIDPSVVIFQEVPRDDPGRLIKKLKAMGYSRMRLDINEHKGKKVFCGNLVAAKSGLRLRHIKTEYLDFKRNAIAVQVSFNGYDIAIIGTHLHDVYNEPQVRLEEAKQITNFIQKEIAPNYRYYLVAGDMNEGFRGSAVQYFQANRLSEVFSGIGWDYPRMTCWTGATIDFILSSPHFLPRCTGAYLWHSVMSDHMPVLADFEITPRRASRKNKKRQHSSRKGSSHKKQKKHAY